MPVSFDAFLFDMDGTLLTSLASAERVWGDWGRRHGLDVRELLGRIHGRRAIDTIRSYSLPGVDAEGEAEAITAAEMNDVGGIRAIEGAARFLANLPADRWAVVTSAPEALARRRMQAAHLELPACLVTAEQIARGKPAPDAYLRASERLQVAPGRCLVFEDAQAGIAAAEAAGATVVVIGEAQGAGVPHLVVANYLGLAWRSLADGRLELHARCQVDS